MNFLWIDVETTGLSESRNDVVQLACIPVINGKIQQSFNEYCQPINWDNIDDAALAVHGITREAMRTFQSADAMVDKLIKFLRSFNTKFIIAGYNVEFDKRFISSLFTKCSRSNEFFDLFELNVHDTYKRAKHVKSKLNTENLKLETLAKHLSIPIDAHDALSDIRASIEVDRHISKLLDEEQAQPTVTRVERDDSIKFRELVQLHLHSMYDMVESVPTIEQWEEWCKANGVPGYSIVDHGYGISLYYMRNSDDDVMRIPGCGLYFMHGDKLFPFNAWAISSDGYFNLLTLSSLGFKNVVSKDGIERPVLTKDDIKKYSGGLVFGTGTVYNPIGEAIMEGNVELADQAFDEYHKLFGELLYVELCPVSVTKTYHSNTGFKNINRNKYIKDGDVNAAYNRYMLSKAQELDLPCVPVSAAHFIDRSDKLVQDVIMKNSYNSGRCYIESYHARLSADIYWELKAQLGDQLTPELFNKWIDNTYDIAERARSIDIKFDYHLPKIDVPKHIRDKTDDYDKQVLLYTIELCKKHGRWRDDPEYVERFKREIDVIMNNDAINFLPYFLVYEDICSYARSQNIMQNIGRGSAGGCLLSYYLKIIHIDPIKNNLPFERFLSFARIRAGSFPDIDCDFGDRTVILKYLMDKYKMGFAQIGTFSTMKTKNAIKDAMWALYGKNRRDKNVEDVCAHIPDSPQGVNEYDFLYGFTNKEGEYTPGIVETAPEVAAFFKQFPQVEELVKKLIGVVRGLGRHASAFVISTLDLSRQRVPVMFMFDKNIGDNIPVTQYEAPMVEKCGLVKADILGVTTIKAISDCIELINKNHGINLNEEDDRGIAAIYRLPEDDKIYADFYNKKTDSSFQFNTPLIKGYLQQMVPTNRHDLSDLTALARPGAMDAEFKDGVSATQYFMDIRQGKREPYYIHDELRPILQSTQGVIVYQEQIMQILVEIGGYTWEEADQIRGAIAKKKHKVMETTFNRIREAAHKRGWTSEQAEKLCSSLSAFARYGFNLSHSRCYSELGYITMYLKHYYDREWWTSILNNTKHEDKRRFYMTLLGDIVRPPSVQYANDHFMIVDNHIVAPLGVLKRLGGVALAEIVSKGPFTDIDDYMQRVAHNKVNIGHFSALLKGRALDCWMDESLPYDEARIKLMKYYLSQRRCRDFTEDMYDLSPLSIFLMERETNTCFNKSVLSDEEMIAWVQGLNPDLVRTNNKHVPFLHKKTPILKSSMIAEALVDKQHEKEVGFICIFNGSGIKKGVSKRTGKPYSMLRIDISDGFADIECVMWRQNKPLNIPINSILLVKGTISEGWRSKIAITANSIEVLYKPNKGKSND